VQVQKKRNTRRIGLARTLSKLGYCSRSQAAGLIRAGRVSLDGKVRRDPETPVSTKLACIAVDGKIVDRREKVYLMMNKPRGIVTTASDEKDRQTVYDVLRVNSSEEPNSAEGNGPWIAPVGRLDKASEGLLLLTNDSGWAARVTAPETHLDKTYHVQINDLADEPFVRMLAQGTKMEDGQLLRAKQARILRTGSKNCWLEIVLDEGKNRQIRRMMEALGVEVLRLIRIAIGPLQLGNLAKGQHRPLTSSEKGMLDRAMRGES
jgi:23S rRNA pseudouridine2605 synthase